jgi:(p)ppGpp synthase/HD superfamily hydrolase
LNAQAAQFVRDLPLTQGAVEFARDRHRGQRRAGDNASFVVHPLEVAALLDRSGYPDHVVAAAALHDVLEDTPTELWEIEARFGSEVSDLVALLTDNPRIADEEVRKDDVRERVRRRGGDAAAIYAADKVSKVRELRTLVARGRGGRDAVVKLRRYRKSLAMLEDTIPGNPLVQLLRVELDALEESPPALSV